MHYPVHINEQHNQSKVWQEIRTAAVNAMGTVGRTVAEVKRNGKTYIAPRRKNLQLSREKQRKLEVGQRQGRQVRPVGKLLTFSRTHRPAFSGFNGFETGT